MKFELNELSYEGEWHDYKDGRLKIRPYPFSKSRVRMQAGEIILDSRDTWDIFDYALEEWEGAVGADDKSIPCNRDVKKKIFDFRLDPEMVNFVVTKAVILEKRKVEQEKNFKTGPDGT